MPDTICRFIYRFARLTAKKHFKIIQRNYARLNELFNALLNATLKAIIIIGYIYIKVSAEIVHRSNK